jgi:hypothetical protein
VAKLDSGEIDPADVPIEYVIRPGGQQLFLNTRSAIALLRARIPVKYWRLKNGTDDQVSQTRATDNLRNNGLDESGFRDVPQSSGYTNRWLGDTEPRGMRSTSHRRATMANRSPTCLRRRRL